MDVTTRPVSPSPATAHPQGLPGARASGAASEGRRPHAVLLRAVAAVLLLGAVAAAAATERSPARDHVELRPPSVHIVPLAP
jgi:hypothetical protein